MLVIVYKALSGLGLKYLKDYLTLPISGWPLRSLGEEGHLQVPPLLEASLVAARERAFSVVVPRSGIPFLVLSLDVF